MSINIRRVSGSDKEKILKISSKIWEGDDYIPFVFDEWVRDENSFFACAEIEGKIVGFGRYVKFSDAYAWLEGLRADPEYQGRGAGKALTNFFIEKAKSDGVKTLALSTYIDNKASMHIIESNGFVKKASFVYFEVKTEKAKEKIEDKSLSDVSTEEAENFIKNSEFLKIADGYLPYGWKFFPERFGIIKVLEKMQFLLAVRKNKEPQALACAAEVISKFKLLSVCFIDGTEEGIELLLKEIFAMKTKYELFEFMIPCSKGNFSKALSVFKKLGIKSYYNYSEDLFVYEKELA